MIDKITSNMEFSNYNFKVHVKDFDTISLKSSL